MVDLLRWLYIKVDMPSPYGWFHILSLLLLAAVVVTIVLLRKRISDRAVLISLIVVWALMVLGDAYRQLFYACDTTTGAWDYDWRYFPFQFCSSPLYVLPCAIFIRHKATKQFFYDFLATYSLFAGLIVMIVPDTVFMTDSALLLVQSMMHHSGMVAIAVLLYATGKVKFSVFTVLRATAVFVGCLAVAMLLNVTIDQPGFNMFYIDWVEGCKELPLLRDIYEVVPYPVFFLIYTVGFMLCATIMHSIAFGADCLRRAVQKKRAGNDEQTPIKEENKVD